jgi:hypothetical protein
MAPQVSRIEVRDEGLVATLFRLSGAGRCPTVIVFGGSGGKMVSNHKLWQCSESRAAVSSRSS